MQNKWVINVLLVIIMFLVIIACIAIYMCLTNDVEIIEKKQEEPLFSQNDYPRVDGSTFLLPLSKAFKSAFTGIDIKDVELEHTKTHNAYINLINESTDLILVTYPTEDEEKIADSQGVELEFFPIVKDALVFLVNKDNPIENLTLNQLKNIYSGKIRNWKDVGGIDSEILAFQKPENSESQNAMLKYVMQGTKMLRPITENISKEDIHIIDVISDYNNSENAIGYSYYYYSKIMYPEDTSKLLSVDGIKPTYENIQTGLYDIQTLYYAVIRKNEPDNSNTRKLLNAMMSEKGQNIAKEAGYVQNY